MSCWGVEMGVAMVVATDKHQASYWYNSRTRTSSCHGFRRMLQKTNVLLGRETGERYFSCESNPT